MATRADVARLAGVSPATVSYALSGKATISEATRQRVLDAMAQLDYTPNAMAQALAGQQTRIIAMLFGGQQRGVLNSDLEYILGAANAARELGYHLLLWPSVDRNVEEVRAMCQSGLLAGVILMEVRLDDERVAALQANGIPVSLIGRSTDDGPEIPHSDRDFVGAMEMAIDYLVGLGHTNIAFVNGAKRIVRMKFGASVRVERAYKAAMRKRRLPAVCLHCEGAVAGGQQLLRQLLEEHTEVTALVELNPEAIIGFMQAAPIEGLLIPQQVSVLSIGTSNAFAYGTVPPLTTIAPPAAEMGRSAARQLIAQLSGGDATDEPRLLLGSLVERGSTGPAPRPRKTR